MCWISFCFVNKNYILWTKLHFVDKITFCGQNYILWTKLHFVDKITFCRQNYILSGFVRTKLHFVRTKLHFVDKITFCGQNYILWTKLHFVDKITFCQDKITFCHDKITFCHDKIILSRQNYILLWLLQFCRRNCILSTEWICSSQFSILSRWRHLLNINYLYISLLSPITFEASHLCNHCIQVGTYSLF